MSVELPIPPLEMRELVGLTDPEGYENPAGAPIFADLVPDLDGSAYRSYLDFGCGCGRSARRLMQQRPRPERYVGIDLHRGMVEWCQRELAPNAPGFEFHHHNVYNPGLNPDPLAPPAAPFPVADDSVSLIEATSVFTHLVEGQAEFYLDEVARVLAPDGVLAATFFLFDKTSFPFMHDFQNALYINVADPTNAVVYDRAWLRAAAAERGLAISGARPPETRGFHWWITLTPQRDGIEEVELPADDAPPARRPPPLRRMGAESIGLHDGPVAEAPAARPRADLTPLDPALAELTEAKRYIASLEEERARLAAPARAPGRGLRRRLPPRIRAALGRLRNRG